MKSRAFLEKHCRLIVFLLLAVFIARVLHVISVQSPTYDETTCLNASMYLMQSPDWGHTITVQHPPLSYFWYGSLLKYVTAGPPGGQMLRAKAFMLFFPVLLGIFVFAWARKLFGVNAALAALALFTLCPNVLAHSGLLTQDILITTFIFLAVYSFERFLEAGSVRTIAFAGTMLGLALLSKYTAVFLGPIYLLRISVEAFIEPGKVKKLAGRILMVFLIGLFILNLGYLFKGSGKPLGSYRFKSVFFNSLSGIPVLARIPAPLPSPYVQGFDIQKYVAELGHPSYLLGETSTRGWKHYFIVAFLIKVPVPVLMLLLAALFYIRRDLRRKLPLLIPLLSLTVPFIALTQSNPGLRYLLPVFPFMYILAGESINSRNRFIQLLTALCVLWAGVESFAAHPHYISYFNRLIGGPANGYKYLADSNIDWGQEENAVRKFLDKRRVQGRSVVTLPQWPAEGAVLVNANNLADCFRAREKYGWLKDFEPAGNIGYSWMLFDINLKRIMERAGDNPRLNYTAAWILSKGGKESARAGELAAKAISLLSGKPVLSRDERVLLSKCFYLSGLIEANGGSASRAEKHFASALDAYPYLYEAYDALSQVYAFKGDAARSGYFKRQAEAFRILEWYSVNPVRGLGHFAPLEVPDSNRKNKGSSPGRFLTGQANEDGGIIPDLNRRQEPAAFSHGVKASTDIEVYKQRIAQDPADYSAYNNLGFLYWAGGDTDAAIQTLEKAAAVLPHFSGTYASLASCYYEKGNTAKVKENLSKFRNLVFSIDSFSTQVVVWGEDRIIFDSTLVIMPEAVIPAPELQELYQGLNF